MTPDQAWGSNPITTSRQLKIIRDAEDPDGAAKRNKVGWARKELIAMQRSHNVN